MTSERYHRLIRYAFVMCKGTQIDPYDITHTAITEKLDCDVKDLHKYFYREMDYRKGLADLDVLHEKKKNYVEFFVCTKCHESKPACHFRKRNGTLLFPMCIDCKSRIDKAYYRANKEELSRKHKVYYQATAEHQRKMSKEYGNSKQGKIVRKAWREANKERLKAYKKAHYAKNRKKYIEKAAEWQKNHIAKTQESSRNCMRRRRAAAKLKQAA